MTDVATDLSYGSVMARPLLLPVERSGPWLDFLRGGAEMNWAVADATSKAPPGALHSICGGCKGLTDDVRMGIFPYLGEAFGDPEDPTSSCVTLVRSGGTREADGKPMVTQAPAYLARLYNLYAFSTNPQTDRMHLNAASGQIGLNKYDTGLDAGQHALAVVQKTASEYHGWDGDVEDYLNAFQAAMKRLGVRASLSLFNGGDVTVIEGIGALVRGIPVIVVEGSLRAADDWANHLRAGTFVDYVRTFIGDEKAFLTTEDVDVIADMDLDHMIHVADLRAPGTFSEALSLFSATN